MADEMSRSVLLVDSNDAMLEIYRPMLSGWGYEVETTTAPFDALERATQSPPDALILALDMEPVTGDALMQELRERGAEFSIVLLAGDTTPEQRDRYTRQGADAIVGKTAFNRLREALGEVLD
jgi:CheY-like chemotaxis protein